jgi:hypothetical protein
MLIVYDYLYAGGNTLLNPYVTLGRGWSILVDKEINDTIGHGFKEDPNDHVLLCSALAL